MADKIEPETPLPPQVRRQTFTPDGEAVPYVPPSDSVHAEPPAMTDEEVAKNAEAEKVFREKEQDAARKEFMKQQKAARKDALKDDESGLPVLTDEEILLQVTVASITHAQGGLHNVLIQAGGESITVSLAFLEEALKG